MVMRVLVLLALFAAPASALAQPDILSEKATKRYQEGYDTYRMMNEYKQLIHPVRKENSLRTTLMIHWYQENMETRLRWVEGQDWTRAYKAMFVRAMKWRKDAFDGGAEKLYRLSHKYLHVPNAEKYGYVGLSGNLLYRAAMAGHAKAMAEFKDHPHQPVIPILLKLSRVYVYKDALENKQNAINGLIVAYLIGTIFDDDRLKGYYWLLRTRGLDVSQETWAEFERSISFLSEGEREKAKGWVASGYIPPM